MNDQQEKRVNLLLTEYKILSDEIKERIGRSDKIIGVGLAVLGAGLAYGIKEKINDIMLILPIGLYGVIFYAIFNSTIVMTLGGHKKYLAERVNTYFGEELLIWENIANRIVHRNIPQICLHIFYALCLAAVVLKGYVASLEYNSEVITISYIVINIALLALLLASLVKLINTFEKSYVISKESWGKKPPEE